MIERALVAPLDLLAVHKAYPERYPYLLQTAAGVDSQSQFDILFAIEGEARSLDENLFQQLDQEFARLKQVTPESHWPFTGGWFLYLGYEAAGDIEPVLDLPSFPSLPAAILHRAPAAIIRNCTSDELCIVAENGYEALADQLHVDAIGAPALEESWVPIVDGVIEEQDPGQFISAVDAARTYIFAGDVFQANLSRPWRARISDKASVVDIYQRLLSHNPAPFAGLAVFGTQAVISSSPERLLEIRNGKASTRPIAGTRPRGQTMFDDYQLSSDLFGSEKDLAEHVMLIDLERNDLGRICQPGTVVVDEFMVLESYAHVHHIVSNVSGTVRPGVTPGQAIAAVFPGGTITGCPKVRCMEIIGELEGEGRGPYTGSMGYVNRDGSLDLNILIRSLHVDGRELTLRAGGGIVWDSEAQSELAETRAKARGLLLALDSVE